MKSRCLKSLLNTQRAVADWGDYIAVGSQLCHNLISVDKKSLKMRYALGHPHGDRMSIPDKKGDLLEIWDKLEELIESGELAQIISGNDCIAPEARIPVFYEQDLAVVESYTDQLGWPNTTFDGRMMHDNTHFATREQALRSAVSRAKCQLEIEQEKIGELEGRLEEVRSSALRTSQGLALLELELAAEVWGAGEGADTPLSNRQAV